MEQTPGGGGESYEALLAHLRRIHRLASAQALLRWDQQVCMPPAGGGHRADQAAEFGRLLHESWATPTLGELLDACESASGDAGADGDQSDAAVIVRETRRRHERARRLPESLVTELAGARSASFDAWREAREHNDFARFRPHLERVLALTRRRAECLGVPTGGEMWDALAEDYEPGMTARGIADLFDALSPRLRELLDAMRGAPPLEKNDVPDHPALPRERQYAFMRHVAERFGFDFTAGRLDPTIHPFCTRIGPGDVRLTVAHRDRDLRRGLGSLTHETGHGIYEQALPREHSGTPLCEPASLGLHEAMARLWENHVGRSRAFTRWCVGELPRFFGDALPGMDAETLYAARNRIEPGLIRTEADELTYHLHIAVRFALERAMLAGEVSAADLPAAWNERYRAELGLEPTDDVAGCMQDVHWSAGSLGYFPCYTLGSLYAAQYFEQAEGELGPLGERFERGDFEALRAWLVERVCRHGRRHRAEALCERVTGAPLSIEPMMRHLSAKLGDLYGAGG